MLNSWAILLQTTAFVQQEECSCDQCFIELDKSETIIFRQNNQKVTGLEYTQTGIRGKQELLKHAWTGMRGKQERVGAC